ncbi:MAG TPA: glycosyltransferase family 2 protein [Aliiroseovarius sp.]|nr:glycosyltransferase family 2 protein [Aliiroseovarius sp.]
MSLDYSNPLVTIITPAYDAERFIAEAISSVQAQTIENWEQIIVDDGSSDLTSQIAKDFAATDARIKIVRLPRNSGAAVARNHAIRLARGRFIAFLDSDDLWHPEKLERQIAYMHDQDAALCFAAYDIIGETNRKIGLKRVPSKVQYHDLLKRNRIGCLTVLYDTQKLGKIDMPLIRKRQDLGLWLKILKRVDHAHGIKDVLATYRQHKNSLSANKLSAASYTWRLYRKIEKLAFPVALFFFAHYAFNGVFRRFEKQSAIRNRLDP